MITPYSKIYEEIKESYEKGAECFSQTRQNFWSDLLFLKKYIKQNAKILDFGCGNGRLINLIGENKVAYLGVDICQKLIRIARSQYPKHKFKLIKISSNFKFARKESYDLIFCIGVFHHFPKDKKRRLILKKLKNSLKSGGILVVTVWNLNQKKYKKYFKNSQAGKIPFRDNKGETVFKRYCYRWKLRELKKFITDTGLKIIDSGETKRNGRPANLYCISKK
jgi:tRNA (uracil-5-)-methyltransferase TRM9